MSFADILLVIIPKHSSLELSISLLLCVILAIFAYWRKILDTSGSVAAFIIGLIIALFGNIYWLITLICFLIVTYIVTKLDFSYKLQTGVAQGKRGERSVVNVLTNGSVPAFIAIFSFQLGYPLAGFLFICSICIAASDSFANEIGVLSNKAYLITNLKKRVRPGTDGGVSKQGQLAAFAGGFIPAMIGWILISEYNNNLVQVTEVTQMPMTISTLILPIMIGFFGCQVDSILGATLQRRKIINNDDVNFLSILITILIVLAIVLVIPIY